MNRSVNTSIPRDGRVALALAIVLLVSACVMALEVAAGRILARSYGSSLHTWTSVIGVVLGGLALGNYLGGRLADRTPPRQALASLLVLASVAGLAAVVLGNRVEEWSWMWLLTGRWLILAHMMILFLAPSAVLGMAGPVAARMALDCGSERGRILGSLSAWSTIGSLCGTFATGYYFITWVGPFGVIWGVTAALAVAAVGVAQYRRTAIAWGCLTAAFLLTGLGRWEWSVRAGEAIGLRPVRFEHVLHEEQSPYSNVRVVEFADMPGLRHLYLDKLLHSQMIAGEPDQLLYQYEQVYAILTHKLAAKQKLTTLSIGGGACVFPMYLSRHWPGSHTEVVEIDPAVTRAARIGFGLADDSPIRIYHLDGRNHVESLLHRKKAGGAVATYDFIYGDAFNDFAPPYHLTTVEFLRSVRDLLAPDGAYLANLIDDHTPGRFLSAMIQTMRQVFPCVYVFSAVPNVTDRPPSTRITWVVAGLLRDPDFTDLRLPPEVTGTELVCWQADLPYLESLRAHNGDLYLTDDYAPVEQLLGYLRGMQESSSYIRYYLKGIDLSVEGDITGAIEQYRKTLQLNPTHVETLNNLGVLLADTDQVAEAVRCYERALAICPRDCRLLCNYGIALVSLGRVDEGMDKYRRILAMRPADINARYNLGLVYKARKQYAETVSCWRPLVQEHPDNPLFASQLARLLAACPEASVRNGSEAVELANRAVGLTERKDLQALCSLSAALAEVGRFDEAISVTTEAIAIARSTGSDGAISQLQEHLDLYRQRKPVRLP